MNLLLLTQRVDERDANLAFHVRWIAELARHATRVTVIAQAVGEYSSLPANVSVHSLGKERGVTKAVQGWTLFRFLARFVRTHDAALVLMIPAYVLAAVPFAWISRRPLFLWYAHGSVSRRLRLAARACAKVFTSSVNGMRLDTPKRHVLGQAIDTELFSPDPSVPRSAASLVTVGRISPVKHLDTLIEAVRILKERGRPVELQIIGEPILEADRQHEIRLRQRVAGLGLESLVRFSGALPPERLPDVYRRATVCVNASTTGSLDKAVLEALACGCLVVTGNEAYRDLLPASAFVSGTAPEAYASALEHVLSEPYEVAPLRAWVVQSHNRERTLGRLYDEMVQTISAWR